MVVLTVSPARGPVAMANPVAKLAVALSIPLFLLLSVDWVSAATALCLELLLLPLAGLGPRELLRRGWLVLLAALPPGLVSVLVGVDGGRLLLELGPVTVTQGSLELGAAITLRVLAIGLPGVVLAATTDPTDLADALAQILRLPSRFVLSAVAALQLAGLVAQEWRSLGLARRARGLQAGFSPAGARVGFGRLFALLVLMVRRATVLATAMEARGFGVTHQRTWARRSEFRRSDLVVAAGGVVIGVTAVAVSVAAGTWHLVL